MPITRIQDFQIHHLRIAALEQEAETIKNLSLVRKNRDTEGIFTLLEWRRPDGTLYKTSQLSGGTPPRYTTRTVRYYDHDGKTVLQEYTYEITYVDDDITGEVVQDA